MNDSLIYPCLKHLIQLLYEKKKSQQANQQFFYANLMIDHFHEARQIFNKKNQLCKALIKYYQENWLTIQNIDQGILKQYKKKSQKQQLACQIVVRIIKAGLHLSIHQQIDKKESKQLRKLCQQLHFNIMFQNLSISQILLRFIEKIINYIKQLSFYEYLLMMFTKLDYFQVVEYLENSLSKFKQEWNKKQQQNLQNLRRNTIKDRNSFFIVPKRQNLSIQPIKKVKSPTKDPTQLSVTKTMAKSVYKPPQKKEPQNKKSHFKQVKTVQKTNLHNSRRQSFYKRQNGFQFKSRKSQFISKQSFNQIDASKNINLKQKQNIHFVQSKYNNRNINSFYGSQTSTFSQSNSIQLSEVDITLVENTPQKRKKRF